MEIISCSYQQVPKWEKYKLRQSPVITSLNSLGHVPYEERGLCGRILYIKLSTKMLRRAMRCTTLDVHDDFISRHHNSQQFGAMFPVELTNEDIKNSAAYKEYYAIASRANSPKTKASVRKTHSSFNTTMPPPTVVGTRLSTLAKGKQPSKSSKAKGLSVLSEVALTEAEQINLATKKACNKLTSLKPVDLVQMKELILYHGFPMYQLTNSDNDDDDFIHPKLTTHDEEAKDEESFDPIVQTPSHVENSDDEGNDDASHGMNVGGDEGPDAEEDDNELYGDVNINLEGRDIQMIDVHTTKVLKDTHVTLTLVNPDGQQQSSSVSSQFITSMLNLSPNRGIDSLFESTHRVDVPVTTTVEPLLLVRDEAQAENEDFLNKLDENIQKIIKEQVKEQFKVQVSKILPKIKKTVNEQLEAKVLTRASNSSKTSYVVAADLSELELKKILIEKIDSNKPGSKRRRAGKEPESTSAPKEKTSKTSGKSTKGSKSHKKTASESALAEELMHTTLDEPSHQEFEAGAADDQLVAEAS
nr:hypothetical protein [Tanacetum cinerariifolium]